MYIAHYIVNCYSFISNNSCCQGTGSKFSSYKGSFCLYRIHYPSSSINSCQEELAVGRIKPFIFYAYNLLANEVLFFLSIYAVPDDRHCIRRGGGSFLFIPSAVPLIITPIHSRKMAIRSNVIIQNPDELAGSCPKSIVMRPVQYPPSIRCVHRHVSLSILLLTCYNLMHGSEDKDDDKDRIRIQSGSGWILPS